MEPSDMDQQIGYLLGKLEEVSSDIKMVVDRIDTLEKNVADKFKTAEVVYKTFKFLGLALLAVLTLKIGDIGRLWQHFWG